MPDCTSFIGHAVRRYSIPLFSRNQVLTLLPCSKSHTSVITLQCKALIVSFQIAHCRFALARGDDYFFFLFKPPLLRLLLLLILNVKKQTHGKDSIDDANAHHNRNA